MDGFLKLMNDLKYTFLAISGGVIAHVPAWVHDLSEWAQVFAKIGGFIAVAFGIFKMIDQFILQRLNVDVTAKIKKFLKTNGNS